MRKFWTPESFICLFTRMFSQLQRTATQCIIYDEERIAPFESLVTRRPVLFLSGRLNLTRSSALNSLMEPTEMDVHPDINLDRQLCTNIVRLTVYWSGWYWRIGLNVYSFRLLNFCPECGESLIIKKITKAECGTEFIGLNKGSRLIAW
jgi:hypothetical protein